MTIGKGTKQGEDLKARAERLRGLDDQLRDLAAQAKDIKAQVADELKEAESAGYSKRTLRQVAKELGEDAETLQERFDFEAELDVYRHAVGVGSAAVIVANEMTPTERLTTAVLGVDSEAGQEAIFKAKARAENKLRNAKRNSQAPLEVVR